MKRLLSSLISLVWLLIFISPVWPQSTAEDVVRRAIHAQGGKENLKKHLTYWVRTKGTRTSEGVTANVEFELWCQHPSHSRFEMKITSGDVRATQTAILDGAHGWCGLNGRLHEADEKEIKGMHEAMYMMQVRSLYPLLEGERFTLTAVPETPVKDRPAVGVKVTAKGQQDVRLYFDKETGLLVKAQYKAVDHKFKDVSSEEILSDYRDVQGAKEPFKLVILSDGKEYATFERIEMRILERIDPKVFAKP